MSSEPIRDKEVLQHFTDYYLHTKQWRNYALIIIGLNTALRISDLLSLKWIDVYDFERRQFFKHLSLVERKTRKAQTIALNDAIVYALTLYFPHRKGPFIFASNKGQTSAICRSQAYRIIKTAAANTLAAARISCHSLRKTFGYHAWKTGAAVSVIMDIFNHSSYNVTRRYLGICQDDRDAVYLGMTLGR